MFVIVGLLVVIGAILGGYLMEHGHLAVLMQPAELIIIGGAAIGTVLIANPLHILKKIVAGLVGVFKSSAFTTAKYLETMKMCYEMLNKARKEGLLALFVPAQGHPGPWPADPHARPRPEPAAAGR